MHMIFKAQLWSRVQCHSPGVFAPLRKENRCILCMMSEWFLAFSADKGCHFLERGYALTNIPGWLIDQDEVYPMFGANPWETQNIWLFTVETWQFGANKETQSWQNIWLIPWNLGHPQSSAHPPVHICSLNLIRGSQVIHLASELQIQSGVSQNRHTHTLQFWLFQEESSL